MTPPSFEVGDKVVLANSRNVMTIQEIRPVVSAFAFEARCVWVVGELPRSAWFPLTMLYPAPRNAWKRIFGGLFGFLFRKSR